MSQNKIFHLQTASFRNLPGNGKLRNTGNNYSTLLKIFLLIFPIAYTIKATWQHSSLHSTNPSKFGSNAASSIKTITINLSLNSHSILLVFKKLTSQGGADKMPQVVACLPSKFKFIRVALVFKKKKKARKNKIYSLFIRL
jgi:hypothetical protein